VTHHSDRSFDYLVIGAGIWGLTAAWRLGTDGARVGVFDDGAEPAAAVAAGMLCPWSEREDDGEHDLDDALRAAATGWPSFATRLEQASGLPSGHAECGSVFVASRPEHLGAVRRLRTNLERAGRDAPWCDADAIRRLEPGLGPAVTGGIALDDEHQVDPQQLLAALREAARRVGVVVIDQRATSVTPDAVTDAGRDTHRARRVILAAGHASSRLSQRLAIRPVKGQIITLRPRGDEPPLLTRLVRSPGVYLVPRRDGRVLVGATSEERSDRDVTVDGVYGLLDQALRLAPGLSEYGFDAVRCGLRPAASDTKPVLGPDESGLVWATGGYRHGALLLPLVDQVIAASVNGAGLPALLAPFSPTRFACA
jgi:glycine oxidase